MHSWQQLTPEEELHTHECDSCCEIALMYSKWGTEKTPKKGKTLVWDDVVGYKYV